MFPEVIYSWLVGILAIIGVLVFVILFIVWVIIGFKIFFD